jgi:hypothetical protein
MTWIYLLESITKKMTSKPPPSFSNFLCYRMDNSRDSHCSLSKEEEGGTMSNYLYRGTLAISIVMSACLSLLMHSSSDGRADITMPITTDSAYRY